MQLSSPSRGGRLRVRAFTLVEIIVALAVMLILAAVAVPSLNGYLDQKTVEDAADRLALVATGIDDFENALNRNTSRLSFLSTIIVKSDPNYLDSCGQQFTKNANINNWENNGPFVNFLIERNTGLVTSIGVARDTLTRIPFSATTGNLRLNFLDGVEQRYAQLLDEYIDAGNGRLIGTVQWSDPPVDGLVTMHYFVPINAQC